MATHRINAWKIEILQFQFEAMWSIKCLIMDEEKGQGGSTHGSAPALLLTSLFSLYNKDIMSYLDYKDVIVNVIVFIS